MLEAVNAFLESLGGQMVLSGVAFTCLLLIAGVMLRRGKFTPKMMSYAAICIALATVLSFAKLFSAPYGGSVTACSMFFIILTGFWFGPAVGILAGITQGLLQFVLDPYIVHPVQMILDYPVAFGLLGLSGLFANRKYGLYIGLIVGVFGRILGSTLSGVLFFAEYTPAGMHSLWYSFVYNGSYMGIEMLITMAIICVPAFRKAVEVVRRQALA